MVANAKQWTYELGFDDALMILGDGKVNVDGIMVSGSRSFVRDPRLTRLADERYRPPSRRGGSRAEITHIPVIPNDPKTGKPMRWCGGGHYSPVETFTKLTRNQFHGKRDGLDDMCSQCRKLQRARHRIMSAQAA